MPHQCVKCSKIIPIGSKEIIEGCGECGSKFFFYIREEQIEKIKQQPVIEIPEQEKKAIEKDVREIAGITDEESPVILDLESIRFLGDGKYEIDVVNLFNKERPLIYKFEEGKYMIDLASTLKRSVKELDEENEKK
jgi:predicted  nucleic acid-binding Zn-ribbon protein